MNMLLPKHKPDRDRKHRQFVAKHFCIACHDGELLYASVPVSQAAHLRSETQNKGMGLKPSDALCVPLCPPCHDAYDGRTKGLQGKKFWEARGIDPVEIAEKLVRRK